MANFSTDELKVLSETDLFSRVSKSLSLKSDYSSVNEENSSWRYLARTYFNNSKQLKSSKSNVFLKENPSGNYYKNLPGAMPISMNEMLKGQNTNAPWLFNILKKKLHRSRKHKKDRMSSNEFDSNNTITNNSLLFGDEFLEKVINNDGISGKWIVHENDITCPLIKNFDISTAGQYNVSRAMSSTTSPIIPVTTDDSLHLCHYHYDFQTLHTPMTAAPNHLADHQAQTSSGIIDETKTNIFNDEDTPIDVTSMTSAVKTYYPSNQQEIGLHNIKDIEMPLSSFPLAQSTLHSVINDVHLLGGNSTIQTRSKRAKSASAARSHHDLSSNRTQKEQRSSKSNKKKKIKYYHEYKLSSEEIELREALRIIDLDNIGFFPPSELRKGLINIGMNTNDIEKLERCLPVDEDGHYSVDNIIKLLLDTKSSA